MNSRSTLPRRRGGALRRLGWFSAAAMLALSAFAPTVSAADPISPIIYTSDQNPALAGNNTCSDFEVEFGGGQDWIDSKLDKSPETGDTVVTSAGTITITAADGDTFSWSSTFGIDAVFVKSGNAGGDGINVLYVYAPTAGSAEATVGTNLTDQGGPTGISHVSFCWDEGTPPTPTPEVTPTPTPEVTPTPTPEVTPTPTPEVTPTPTPEVTPTPTPEVTPTPTPEVTPTPAPVGAIEILKIDNKGTVDFEDDEFLDGASFSVYMDDGDALFSEIDDTLVAGPEAAVDGQLTVDNLSAGSYWIVEVVVPAGFVGSDPILIDLNLDGSVICLWDSTGSLGCEDAKGEGGFDVVFVDNSPVGNPTPTPGGSELPVESGRPTPTGGVEGATGTPGVTPPATDAIGDASSTTSGSWRVVLAGLAALMVLVLLFTQPTRVRRDR